MREIIDGVQRLAMEELIRANKKFLLFASDHEAYGVLAEEINEVMLESKRIETAFKNFEDYTFHDMEELKTKSIRRLRASAVLCAAECIQVIAMCDKQRMSKKAKLRQSDTK